MKCIEFDGQDVVLGAPPGWDAEKHGECGGLPVKRVDGSYLSLWKPSEKDIEALMAGGRIVLSVFSDVHPPVSVYVQDACSQVVE